MKAASTQRGKDRFYPCPKCGDTHPSLTTILGVIGSRALMGWMAKNSTTKLNLYYDIVQNYVDDSLLGEMNSLAEERWWLKEGTHFWKSGAQSGQDAADIGTLIHAWVQAHLEGKEISIESLPQEGQNAVQAFLKWKKEHTLKTIATERTFYACRLNFAGTADWVGEIDGELTMMDWKSSSSIYFSYAIQSFGYAIADEMENAARLYRQVAIGRFGKTGDSEIRFFKRNGSPSIETARDIIIATGHIFAAMQKWDAENPWEKKRTATA